MAQAMNNKVRGGKNATVTIGVPTEEAKPNFLKDTTQEELEEDERIWDEKFAATPDEVFDKMVRKVRADIAAGKTKPLPKKRK